MRRPLPVQTNEIADGHSATSAQPRHATADLIAARFSSPWPRPDSQAFAFITNGAPQEGLLIAPLSSRSQDREAVAEKPIPTVRNSR